MRTSLVDLLKSGVKVGEYCDSTSFHNCLVMSFVRDTNFVCTNGIICNYIGVSPIRCVTFLELCGCIRKSNQIDAYKVKILEKYKDDVITSPILGDMHITYSSIFIKISAFEYVKVDYSGRINEYLSEYETQRQCKSIGFEIVGKLKRKITRNILEELRKNDFFSTRNHFTTYNKEKVYMKLTRYATE